MEEPATCKYHEPRTKKNAGKEAETRDRSHTACWWAGTTAQPEWKSVCQFLDKLNTEPQYNPAIAFLGFFSPVK